MNDNRTITVALTYPTWWNPYIDEQRREIEAIDPRIKVVEAEYQDSAEVRSDRGRPPYDKARAAAGPVPDELRAVLAEAEVIVGFDLPFAMNELAPNLRWVQAAGAGVAQLESADLAQDVLLTTGSGSNSIAIAEFIMGRILQVWKRFREIDVAQSDRAWNVLFGKELAGATLGLVGLGAINTDLARRARAFDLNLLAIRQSGRPSAEVDEVFGPDGLHEVLSRSDIVVSAVPESDSTDALFDAAAFAAMPASSMFVNVGRGNAVDEAALIAALESGHLQAAAIDVTTIEPLPPGDPLWSAPNLYLSAHCSTDPSTLFIYLHQLILENLHRYLAGEELKNLQ